MYSILQGNQKWTVRKQNKDSGPWSTIILHTAHSGEKKKGLQTSKKSIPSIHQKVLKTLYGHWFMLKHSLEASQLANRSNSFWFFSKYDLKKIQESYYFCSAVGIVYPLMFISQGMNSGHLNIKLLLCK